MEEGDWCNPGGIEAVGGRPVRQAGVREDGGDSLQQTSTQVRGRVITDEENGHEQRKGGAARPAPRQG